MVLCFDTTYRHISQDGFLQRDGFIIYQDAKRRFEGHEAKDVIYHYQNLQKFSPSPRQSFRSDEVKLDDLFRRLEEVTHQSLTDIYKLVAFLTHFHEDTRPGVAIRIQRTMLMKATYAMTYKSVCDMTAFEDTPHHRASATELCRKYGLGTCPYADADCRHIHRGKAGSMLKLTGATPPTSPPSTWPSTKQKPYPNHISQHHRAAIGPMMGKVSPTNPMLPFRDSATRFLDSASRI